MGTFFDKVLDIAVIGIFLFIDFLLFHDFFKPGEPHTVIEYAVGILSIIVVIRALFSLFSKKEEKAKFAKEA